MRKAEHVGRVACARRKKQTVFAKQKLARFADDGVDGESIWFGFTRR